MASIRANPNQIALCDMTIYGTTIDPADKEWRTQPRVNTQIFCFIETCEDIGFVDDDLFAEFKSTIQGWDADLLKKSSQPIRTKQKAFLRDNGVYVSNSATVSDPMQELLLRRVPGVARKCPYSAQGNQRQESQVVQIQPRV